MVFFPIGLYLAVGTAHAFLEHASSSSYVYNSFGSNSNLQSQQQVNGYNRCSYCHYHGWCYMHNQHMYCHCDDTHEGTFCEHVKVSTAVTSVPQANTCTGHTCNGHGTCIVVNHNLNCLCDNTHEGTYCEQPKTDSTHTSCDRSYCNDQGNCENINGIKQCQCDYLFAGDRCDLTDFCLQQHCEHGSTCEITHTAPNYFQCICPQGYTGTFCEKHTFAPLPVTIHAPVTTHKPSTTTTTTTQKPTTTTSTTTSTTTTTTTTTTTAPTTTQAYVFNSCMKFAVITTVARNASVDIAGAPACPDGSHTSSEAFPLSTCNVPQPADWKQGKRVMDDCASIPAYTPIATFLSGNYPVGQGLAGVFLECLNPGFKMALQSCVHSPVIIHVESGTLTDPNIYYTIQ
ncbi:protein eyes shut-like [Dreissena polymorpha]|nr:protein eyes shut-like [Dreissena polymorpha]